MHCLLCHEKISKIRHWRTKSEFCCDEHAAIHRRQTLERLVGYVASSPPDGLSIFAQQAGENGEEADAPPLPLDSLEKRQKATDVPSAAAAASTGAGGVEEEEFPLDPEWLQTGEEAAAEEAQGSELAEVPPGDTDFAADEERSEDSEDDTVDFAEISVQRDEPFPVEILTAEPKTTGEQQHPAMEASEPIEPAASIDAPDPVASLDLLATGSARGSQAAPETLDAASAAVSELDGARPETAEEVAQAILERESAGAPEQASEQNREAETPPSSQTLQEVTPAEATVEADSAESSTAATSEAAEASERAEDAAVEQQVAAPTSKGTRPGAKGFGLRPVKTWDPSRGRSGGKKRGAGRPGTGPAGNVEGLNQLAEGVGERGPKARSMGPGTELRREGGRKSVLVCFLPVQGGNGASTVSLHVAEAISHHLNQRVLLADFDFHSGTLAFRLGLKPAHTLGDVFDWSQSNDQLWENVVCRWKKLDVLVAPPSNSSIHPQNLDKLPEIFGSALERYPYVIVDHPDAIYSSSRHILTLSDLVYLVCTPEITSLHLARRKVQQIRAMGVPGERLRLIVNRTGSWGSLGVQDVGKIVGVPVSWALNNDYAALRDAVWNGGLVQDGSELAKQLRELGWSVMGVDAPVAAESAAPTEIHSPVG